MIDGDLAGDESFYIEEIIEESEEESDEMDNYTYNKSGGAVGASQSLSNTNYNS